jgi:hypothetical protein
MFKQILIILLILVIILTISYFIIRRFLINKLDVTKNIIKYPLNRLDKIFLNNYSSECNISELVLLNNKKLIFYTDTPWSTKDNNYIEDLSDNKYYIIDKDYYYYLDSLKDYKLFIESNNVKIRLFDFDKYYKKINYI